MPTQNTVKERMCGDGRSLGGLRRKRPKCTANGESRVFGELSCVTVHSGRGTETLIRPNWVAAAVSLALSQRTTNILDEDSIKAKHQQTSSQVLNSGGSSENEP